MVILVTGARGLLGNDLCKVLSEDHKVIPLGIEELDVTLPETIQLIKGYSPNLVCHLAAYTDVDGCEKDPEKAFLVNKEGTRNVTLGCKKAEVPILYLSTDYLFDGEKGEPYQESDPPNPINVYGRSKLEGEKVIQENLKEYFIVRSSWLFGKGGKNFVDIVLKLADERKVLEVVTDQVGCPTYTPDLSSALKRLMDSRGIPPKAGPCPFGIYHITNSGSCSWYDFAKKIFELAGIEDCRLLKTDSAHYPRPAKRPSYSVLDSSHFQEVAGSSLRSWEEALKEYLQKRVE